MEQLTGSRTLRAVIEVLEAALARRRRRPPREPATHAPGGDQRPFDQGPAEEERIGRFVVQAASAPAITATAAAGRAGAVVIVDDDIGVADELARALEAAASRSAGRRAAEQPRDAEAGRPARRQPCATGRGEGPGPSRGAARPRRRRARDAPAARPGAAPRPAGGGRRRRRRDPRGQPPRGRLRPRRELATPACLRNGALAGFLKTVAHEWPDVRVKAVDLVGGVGRGAGRAAAGGAVRRRRARRGRLPRRRSAPA